MLSVPPLVSCFMPTPAYGFMHGNAGWEPSPPGTRMPGRGGTTTGESKSNKSPLVVQLAPKGTPASGKRKVVSVEAGPVGLVADVAAHRCWSRRPRLTHSRALMATLSAHASLAPPLPPMQGGSTKGSPTKSSKQQFTFGLFFPKPPYGKAQYRAARGKVRLRPGGESAAVVPRVGCWHPRCPPVARCRRHAAKDGMPAL